MCIRSGAPGRRHHLCEAIEKLARARGATKLIVDASDTARPLFEKRGFVPRYRKIVELGGEWLGNTRMEKQFESSDPKARSQ